MSNKSNMDYWKKTQSNLPESFHQWFAAERKHLQKMITPNAKVLDVGCGEGRSISDIISITKNIVALDHDEKAIDDAVNNFSKFPSIKFVKAEAEKMPFNDEEFDFVICMGSFTNFGDNKFSILDEMTRVLKEFGKIIISAFSEDAFNDRAKVYEALGLRYKIIRNGNVVFENISGDNISQQFTKSQLEDIFSRANLQVESIDKTGIGYICTLSK